MNSQCVPNLCQINPRSLSKSVYFHNNKHKECSYRNPIEIFSKWRSLYGEPRPPPLPPKIYISPLPVKYQMVRSLFELLVYRKREITALSALS